MDELAKIVLEKLSCAVASRPDWIALLDLSEDHHHPEARRLAIQNISPTFDKVGLEQVVMARKYRVRPWLRKGLQLLVDQDQFFSDGVEEILGLKTVFKLCRLREQRLKDSIKYYRKSGHRRPTGRHLPPSYKCSLETDFHDELCVMEDGPLEDVLSLLSYSEGDYF